MDFSERIRKLREEKHVTQEELGGAIHVSRSAVAKWEQGRGMPSLASLEDLSKYFSITIDALLGENGIERLQKRDKRRVLSTTIITCAALILSIISLTLYGISFTRPKIDIYENRFITIKDVETKDSSQLVNYDDNGINKTALIPNNTIKFRNFNSHIFTSLATDDEIYITGQNEHVTSAVVLDNPNASSTIGYNINITDRDGTNFHFEFTHSIKDHMGIKFTQMQTNIDSLYSYSSHHIHGIEIGDYIYDQTILQSKFVIDKNYLDTLPNSYIYVLNSVRKDLNESVSLSHLDAISINTGMSSTTEWSGYFFEGNKQNNNVKNATIKDLITYNVTIDVIRATQTLEIEEYDKTNTHIKSSIITAITELEDFVLDSNTSYVKCYQDGDIKGNTIEKDEKYSVFLANGTPIPVYYNFSF